MGTYYTKAASKQDIIRERTDTREWVSTENGKTYRGAAIAWRVVGDCLWTVRTCRVLDGEDWILVEGPYIGLDLLSASGYGWGYKPMDESVHPYYYSCPLEFLDLATEPRGINEKWRAAVRQYHAEEAERTARRRIPVMMGSNSFLLPFDEDERDSDSGL